MVVFKAHESINSLVSGAKRRNSGFEFLDGHIVKLENQLTLFEGHWAAWKWLDGLESDFQEIGWAEGVTVKLAVHLLNFQDQSNLHILLCSNNVISQKFLIKYYEYSFDYLIITMNQLRLTSYLVYSMVCSLPDTDLRNLLNSQTLTLPQDNSDRSIITPVGTCQNHICTALCRYCYYDTTGLHHGLQVFKLVV